MRYMRRKDAHANSHIHTWTLIDLTNIYSGSDIEELLILPFKLSVRHRRRSHTVKYAVQSRWD